MNLANSEILKSPARIFILGSCVSRDIFELDLPSFELAGYLARTSMAGFGLPPVSDDEVRACATGLQSPFQRSMALNDLDKTTLSRIKATECDFILLDFIDERFSLVRGGEGFFSLSGELERAGFVVGTRDVITPDSSAFEHLWLAGFERFVRSVGADRIILNKAFWASATDDPEFVISKSWVDRNNEILSRLYTLIEHVLKLQTIHYPLEVIVGDSKHKWGVAPYHYTAATYQHAAAEILRCINAARDLRCLSDP
ncbi:DUF6270 domain-containing protein [Stenotrophomonas sp. Iso1]|uniref:DUF6270 domain-containing protein n=1 Tax=Stenotrophomonas sp. Iso1 TaxID=2977283 RepID=UPI0022B7A756|nr:DUF6270 domain-containing protein [Stenotrophomonas sp. Iso1]